MLTSAPQINNDMLMINEQDCTLPPVDSSSIKTAGNMGKTSTCDIDGIVAFLDESKAEQIVKIDLQQKSPFADYMIVANGRSPRHLRALGENLRHYFHKHGIRTVRLEGLDSLEWVLVDGGDVIVHLFKPESRDQYNLEKLWSPAYRRAS